MNIIFSPEYSGIVYIKPDNATEVLMDTLVVNTVGLVNMLELRLGLHYNEMLEQERLAHYYDAVLQYMEVNPQNVLAASFWTSGLATAKAMLSWRDELRGAEWDFDGKDISNRLAVLIGVEEYFRKQMGCDWAGCLHIVTDQVRFQELNCSEMVIQIPISTELLKPTIQKLIGALEAQGAKVTTMQEAADLGNNLSKVRQMISSRQKGKITLDKDDESILIWKFPDERTACEYLSYHAMEDVDVWINADNKQMDNWMKLMGKPTTGSAMVDSTPQLTQLFVMGLGLFAHPLNIHMLIGWLQMPEHPLDRFFRLRLVDAIVKEGGYRNETCRKLVEEYAEGKEKLYQVFLPAFTASPVIQTADVRHFVKELSVWAKQRAHWRASQSDKVEWVEQLVAVSDRCNAFSILLDTHKEDTIDYATIDSWISTISQKMTFPHTIAQRGGRVVVDNPAKIASVSEKTIWMGVDGEVNSNKECAFLYPSEKKGLTEQQCLDFWKEESETNYRERTMLTPLWMTSGQLILVVRERVGGEPPLKHPLMVRLEQQVENIHDFIRCPYISVENRHEVKRVEKEKMDAELHFGHAEKIKWPDYMSPTTIDTLVEHPFDYLMERLLDVTGNGMAQMADVKTTKGNVAHAVIEILFAPREDNRCSLPDEIAIRMEQEFEDAYARALEEKGAILQLAENRMNEKLLHNQLRNCLDVLIEILQENELKVTGCECCLKVDDVLGIIDMTLEDKNGHPVVFDFKWTTWTKGYQEKLTKNRSIQLEYYRWLLGCVQKDQVERVAYFIMPDAKLYSKEAFLGRNCIQFIPGNRDSIVEQLRQSILYRKEQIASGIIETNGVYEELQYVKDTSAKGLFPLNKNDEGTKEGNFFTQYELFYK